MIIVIFPRLGEYDGKNLSWWSDDDHEAGKKGLFSTHHHSPLFFLFSFILPCLSLLRSGGQGWCPGKPPDLGRDTTNLLLPSFHRRKIPKKILPPSIRPSLLSHFGGDFKTFQRVDMRNDMLEKDALKQNYIFWYYNLHCNFFSYFDFYKLWKNKMKMSWR